MPERPLGESFTSGDQGEGTSPSSRALVVETGPDDDRVAVTVSGEFRLDDSQNLRRALVDALSRSATGVDLDLGRLTFADCSALNVLLAIRRDALVMEKTIAVTAASPAAERLLTFTDTYELFTTPPSGPSGPPSEGANDGLLQSEVVQLRRALRTRPDIDLARGILMASFNLDPDQAWEALVTASQHTNTKLHRLAKDVVAAVHGAPLPDPVKKQLTEAVTRAGRAAPQRADSTRAEPARESVECP
ncbi:ANTAR domain-containing protein [Streptomyces sp. CA-249302]|uniref:ANTAR domain-containing protein n=1 Tax=Streptomyces sp. CA-249302 TaxID=3240058 RepID=UPI003D933036